MDGANVIFSWSILFHPEFNTENLEEVLCGLLEYMDFVMGAIHCFSLSNYQL